MIGSNLGSEAAQAALAALTTKDPGVHLAAGTAMILEDAVADVERSSSENPGRFILLSLCPCFALIRSYLVFVSISLSHEYLLIFMRRSCFA